MVFAGKRWKVIKIRQNERIIEVIKAEGGVPPPFCTPGGKMHDRIVKEMFRVYLASEQPLFLNEQANYLLNEGKRDFIQNELKNKWFVKEGEYISFFTWSGSKITDAICLLLLRNNLKADLSGQIVIQVKTSESELLDTLKAIEEKSEGIDSLELAMGTNNKMFEKYDSCLSNELLSMDYEKKYLDLKGAINLIQQVVSGKTPEQFYLASI